METTTIDMRPEPFELPFKYEQLDLLAKNRLNLWLKRGLVLGEGSVFASYEWGMMRNSESGEMDVWSGNTIIQSKDLTCHLHNAKDFIEYHERHAAEHGGLNVEECHEWGNAKHYDGGDIQPRSLLYGVRLTFNDGTQLFHRIESKLIEEL
jgi:hypothetical protein